MSSVVTQGYKPQGSLALVVSFGYELFSHITPPTPPVEIPTVSYGPALSPAERRKWFGDFESPLSRAARRKCKEYLQRVEFGILPPEVKEELCVKAVEAVPEKAVEYFERKEKINPDRIINAVMKEMKSEIRQVLENRRILLEEASEEEDIVVISTFLLH